uniref:NADH-ubiquinone oxidoreductase chain 2 n=1 Tax=Pseudothericles compressifrons TaxID=1564105 RepID=A0A0N7AXQ1_9ORTH|nr:NADH dehydrogenase subunit 2 [Pseudothericles compressifrons]AJW76356.1 NADH dehydrogenase subunit 2 [Pseudothericles compressifrons]
MLFLSSLMMGSMLSVSSNSWLGVWMGLEINMLSFIPLMSNSKNTMMNETSIKYFIIQALASTMLLFSIILIQSGKNFFWEETNNISMLLIISSLMMKLGAAPFHFWFPEIMSASSWMNCFILMTWQKIAPMTVMSYCLKMNYSIIIFSILSVWVGALGGLNQTSLRQLMAYSSISHIGWMMASMGVNEIMWQLYFIVYSMLSLVMTMMFNENKLFFMNQLFNYNNENIINKFMIFITLLSLGGLPPFLGFLPKWMVMQTMMEMGLSMMTTIMVILTIITLYYYLRISFVAFMMSTNEIKWNFNMTKSNLLTYSLGIMTMISSLGLMLASTVLI